jgi:hypothetical protein
MRAEGMDISIEDVEKAMPVGATMGRPHLADALVSKKIVNNFPFVTFVGKTNKGNLVFENKNKQLKVSPNGNIL